MSSPFTAFRQAARKNLFPGLVLQVGMLLLLLGFYSSPTLADNLTLLSHWKQSASMLFAIAASITAGAFAPEVFAVLFFQRGQIRSDNFRNLLFTIPFWAVGGAMVETLYNYQAFWFGEGIDFRTIATKVIIDQFVYNPLIAATYSAWAYELKHHGLSRKLRAIFTWHYYHTRIVPLLLATWCVWVPVVCLVYSLPTGLQVPCFAIALCYWSLMMRLIAGNSSSDRVA